MKSTGEIGCGKEETGKEDMEEEKSYDVNMSNEKTQVEVKDRPFSVPKNNQDQNVSENVDLKTEKNDVKSLGLPSDNHGLHGNNKDMELESVDNDEKGHESDVVNQDLADSAAAKTDNNDLIDANTNELSDSKNDVNLVVESVAAKTDNNASVDVKVNEFSSRKNDKSLVVDSAAAKTNNNATVDVIVNEFSGSKNDGSLVHRLNLLECVAADKKSSEIKDENDEKMVKLDDASGVDVSADDLSGSKNDGSQHLLYQVEGAADDERMSEIKTANDEKGGKLDDTSLVEVNASELSGSKNDGKHAYSLNQLECAAADERSSDMKAANDEKREKLLDVTANKLSGSKIDRNHEHQLNQLEHAATDEESSDIKAKDDEKGEQLNDGVADMELPPESDIKESKLEVDFEGEVGMKSSNFSFLYEPPVAEGDESGTEEEQAAFVKEVETFYKERSLEFKHPKFYKEDLNLLKLWRAVIKLGGYDEVTSCKLWRQVGESFNPPKTCTTVSWTFRIFYEKALLEYEKHRMHNSELPFRDVSLPGPSTIDNQASGCQSLGSGRARRDAAARAMQGWHSKRLLGSGEVCQPIIKEKNSSSTPKSDRQIKNIGILKRKKPSTTERTVQVANIKSTNLQSDTMVIDVGPPADWVKINVQRTSDCFEVYALVPGLLREEVHVQSDPAGRLVIFGQPEQLDNPWGVTPFKKVVSLPSRIDPHQTSAVVTLHGQLFVRVPFEQSDL